MTASCVFCRIASGELPSNIVHRDARVVAFLDASPLFLGHTLVVPIDHVPTLDDLPAELTAPLFDVVRRMSVAVQRALDAEGSFVAANTRVSQSVAHVHVHVVPRRRKDGLRGFFWPRQKYESDAAMAAVAEQLRVAISSRRAT